MASEDSKEAHRLLEKIKQDNFDVHSDFGSVINLLRNDRDAARRKAALCFQKIAKEHPVDARTRKSHILQRLDDEDTAVQAEALTVLKNLAMEYPDSIREDLPKIVSRIQDEPYVRKKALEVVLVLSKEYPDEVREYDSEIINALDTADQSTGEIAAEIILQITDSSDTEILQEAKNVAEGDSEEIIQEKIQSGNSSEVPDAGKEEDKISYQEASSVTLPSSFLSPEFKNKIEQGDYFRLAIGADSEDIYIGLSLTSKKKKGRNYCRALSSDRIYIPTSIFAALGLHDNQIEWIESDKQKKKIRGKLNRPEIRPELPSQSDVTSSKLNSNTKGSSKAFDVKLDLEGGHKPEEIYLDIVSLDGDLGISATPIGPDETVRDLPNVSENTGQAKHTLQFRIPSPIGYALGLDNKEEFVWFTQGGEAFLVFSDYGEIDNQENTDTENEVEKDTQEYEEVEEFMSDIEHKTLSSQRNAIRRKIQEPELGPEHLVNYPEIGITKDAVRETLIQYEQQIKRLSDDIGDTEDSDSSLGDRDESDDNQKSRSSQPDSETGELEESGNEHEAETSKKSDGDGSGGESVTQEVVPDRVLEFSEEGVRINEDVEKPLTGGKGEVTIEEVGADTFPIEDLELHVTAVEANEGNKLRLHFDEGTSDESDTEYLLYFTTDTTELREVREKVLEGGKKEVTIEEISWSDEVSEGIDMHVSGIRLDGNNPATPVLELKSIDKNDA